MTKGQPVTLRSFLQSRIGLGTRARNDWPPEPLLVKLMGRVWVKISGPKVWWWYFPPAFSLLIQEVSFMISGECRKYDIVWLCWGSIHSRGNNDQLLAWVPLLLHTHDGSSKKIGRSHLQRQRAESCSEIRGRCSSANTGKVKDSIQDLFHGPQVERWEPQSGGAKAPWRSQISQISQIHWYALNNYLLFQASSCPSVACSNMFKLRGANCKPTPCVACLFCSFSEGYHSCRESLCLRVSLQSVRRIVPEVLDDEIQRG